MQLGFFVSLLMHAGVLAWAFASIQSTPPFRMPELEPVEVALISPDDLVRLKKGDRNSKQLETQQAEHTKEPAKKEQPKAKTEATAPPSASAPPPSPPVEPKSEPPSEPAKAEAPKPEPPKQAPPPDPIAEKLASLPPQPEGPSLEQVKQQEAEAAKAAEEKQRAEEAQKAEEAKKAEDARKSAEKKKADAKKKADDAKKKRDEQKRLADKKRREQEAKKKEFDANRIAALLNKVPDSSAPAGSPEPPTTPTKAKGPAAGAPEGRDSVLTASQRSLLGVMMKRAVSRCWNINSGLEGIDRVVVEVEVRLGPDGRLQQTPRVVNSGPGSLFSDAANSAVRALVQCEPYDMPAEFYQGGWDHMVVTFDPQRMF